MPDCYIGRHPIPPTPNKLPLLRYAHQATYSNPYRNEKHTIPTRPMHPHLPIATKEPQTKHVSRNAHSDKSRYCPHTPMLPNNGPPNWTDTPDWPTDSLHSTTDRSSPNLSGPNRLHFFQQTSHLYYNQSTAPTSSTSLLPAYDELLSAIGSRNDYLLLNGFPPENYIPGKVHSSSGTFR